VRRVVDMLDGDGLVVERIMVLDGDGWIVTYGDEWFVEWLVGGGRSSRGGGGGGSCRRLVDM